MADSALKKIEDQLNCSICLDTYTNPKLLQCNHIYCQQCLVKLVIRDQQGRLILTCPNCRQVTPVPASGVAGLQTAFHINQLLEIVKEHKVAPAATSVADKAERVPTPHENVIATSCSLHSRKEELYCENCEKTICWKCIKKGEKHHSHDYQELNEAFERYKSVMKALLEPIEKRLVIMEDALAEFNTRHDKISDQQAAIEADIHDTFTRLHQTLDARKTELISQLHQLTQTKLKSLAAQRDLLETAQAQLSSYILFMRENLQTGNQGEALLMKSTTLRQVKELTTTFQPDMLEPNTEADMIFSSLADLEAECQNYGEVYVDSPPDPSKCCATGKGLGIATVGEKATALFQTVNSNSEPCQSLTTSISCQLSSAAVATGTKIRGHVQRKGQTQYKISYQPTIKGRHQLHITVEGQHIRGSPFQVTVWSPLVKLRAPYLSIAGVRSPMGVAVNKKGEVVVTEWGGHCVTVYSSSGERLRSFGRRGSGTGRLNSPIGLVVDAEDNILVCDRNYHRIQKFTAQGEFLTAVGSHDSGPLQFDHPRGIAVSASNGQVYISGNHDIQILNSDLSYVGRIGKEGSGKGQFSYPHGLACDSTGNVYVADKNNDRIQAFTPEGKFLRKFGKCGEGRGELIRPYGVAVDSSDRVYVTEQGNHRVSVFTSEGHFVTVFGSEGWGPELYPCGVAVDSTGVVYVCDQSCVHLFRS